MLSSTNNILFFGYGIYLESRLIRFSAKKDEKIIGTGILPGHKIVFCPDPSVIKTNNEHDVVWGVLYSLSSDSIREIEETLGYPTLVSRMRRKIFTIDGEFPACLLFKASKTRENNNLALPNKDSLDIMRIAAKNLNLPKNYQDFLNKMADN